MSYEAVKGVARTVGLYRAARWVHRHVLDRTALQAFRDEVAFYRGVLPAQALCFDVGANYGAKTEALLRTGARVVAFEPQPDCMAELQSRIGSEARLTPVRAAVGSAEGSMTLYVSGHRSNSSLVRNWENKEVVDAITVDVTTLDRAIDRYGVPHYCKIDVEGYELEVLKGLNRRIPLISFEYHQRGDGIERALACLEHLARLGSLQVNVTQSERLTFARDGWWAKEDFREFFQQALPSIPGYHYGDIFVRLT